VEHLNGLSLQQRIEGTAAAVIALAAFLPWVSIFGISANGINGDGKITLVLALAALFALATQTGITGDLTLAPGVVLGVVITCAAISFLVGIADMNEFAAIGIYLTLIGAIVMGAAVVWEIRLGRAATRVDVPSTPSEPGAADDGPGRN
jgi:hypothetical protein